MSSSEKDPERPHPLRPISDELTAWREGWWEEAFERTANASERRGHARGIDRMYIIISYDISSPKRLRKVAECCLNYGVRVQLSVYEFRLPADLFDQFWNEVTGIADPDADKIVAYPMHGAHARAIRTFGTMVCSDQVVCYLF